MTTDPYAFGAEHAKPRGERTDSSIKRLPGATGWRARPTLGTDPVTGKQVRPTKVFATKKAAQDWVTDSGASGARPPGRRNPPVLSMRSPTTG
jgi:hypothetical protein